ncbi:unnamed protein product [Oppiella nova]|uniref:Amino acid transporter n=1 Tax=Oppiella nova TaxID=334625 RepID=A0A7R9LS16_9ACAR|nr:unnamed protein product [Oppiella nova]CAG2166403.1 unnamed protein product [Oppiella nova]
MCVFGIILGVATLLLDDKVPGTKQFLNETNLIIMQVINILMKAFPMAIVYWMVLGGIQLRFPKRLISQLLWFFVTALAGFVIMLFVVHAGVYLFVVRKNPFTFYKKISPAIILALGTASSAITLPVTIDSMEKNVKLPESITRFVLPLGMNVHMNGFALYYPMVILFVAQMHGMDVGLQHMFILTIMTLVMSVAIPAISSGGAVIVTFVAFCASIGIENPLDVLAYTTTADWIMSRLRTATNVIGDCFVAAIVAKHCVASTPQNEGLV